MYAMKVTERQMQVWLHQLMLKKSRHSILPNVSMYGWEADLVCMTKADYMHELEIKISRSDFKADFKKRKHMFLSGKIPLRGSMFERIPNYFWYVCPWGLIQPEEVPEYAGLIWVNTRSYITGTEEVWKAPKIHTNKVSDERKEDMRNVTYWRMWSAYDKIAKLQQKLDKEKRNG